MRIIKNGFTLIEMLIVVAIVAVISSVAIPMYKNYVIRSQFTEMFTLIQGAKTNISTNIKLNGSCRANDSTDTMTGKYGVLVSTGDVFPRSEQNNPSEVGCSLTYTFNDNADPKLRGQLVTVFIDTDNGLYLNYSTIDPEDLHKWIPRDLSFPTISGEQIGEEDGSPVIAI